MKPTNPSLTNNVFSRILIIAVAISITVVVFKLVRDKPSQRINITNGTILETQPAQDWFAVFKADKISFDKKLDNTTIDVYGPVTKINFDENCISLEMSTDEASNEKLIFSNCNTDKGQWKQALSNIEVGNEVRIKGIYSGQSSSASMMVFKNCRVVIED